jgi:hypothetical protein
MYPWFTWQPPLVSLLPDAQEARVAAVTIARVRISNVLFIFVVFKVNQ